VPADLRGRALRVDLEETQLLASFDAFQVFGNDTPLRSEVEWREIRDQTLVAEQRIRSLPLTQARERARPLRAEIRGARCHVLRSSATAVQARQIFIVPRADLHLLPVLDQECAVAIVLPTSSCFSFTFGGRE
jgi:hypothetical protein